MRHCRVLQVFSFLVFCSCIPFVLGQTFTQTAAWRSPSITVDVADRTSLAQDALSVLSHQINYTSGATDSLGVTESAALLLTMSEYDLRMGSTVFQSNVTAALQAYAAVTNWTTTPDRLRWGLAFFAAYQAYPDSPQQQSFLDSAKASWAAAHVYYVTPAAAANGSLPGLPLFEPTCSPLLGGIPATVAGATFWVGQPIINGETIGPWIALSSSLYTATFNTTYRDAAQQSIQFVKNFLSNGTMILDTYEIQGCSVMSAGTFTYNGGYFLQGASIYYGNVTTPSAQDVSDLNELVAGLILFPGWTRADGVNFEDQITNTTGDLSQEQLSADWKAILVSGLYQCMAAGLLNSTVANLTQRYIAVQFNAVRELANYTTSGINGQVYGPSWVGAPLRLQQYLAYGQLAAAELFTVALGTEFTVTTSNSTIVPSSTASSRVSAASSQVPQPKSLVGPIVGGVVGGVGVILIGVLIGVLLWRRRRRQTGEIYPTLEPHSAMSAEPFILTTEEYPDTRHPNMLAQAVDSPARMTKLQPMRYIPTASDLTIPAESQSPLGSATSPRTQNERSTQEGMVSVDAGALQRLLVGIGGALSDLQRREGLGGPNSGVEPPRYDDSQ
ncbi:unnamed protein product [Peniophora sp. CBMAI 1063]|nr:unnamed protein product [Peniophora sp. CBMAI 1063]